MYTKPNINANSSSNSKKNKRNQIGRKFSRIFDVLLDPGFYEGTKYAKYFNTFNADGTSKIYVPDPLEEELMKLENSSTNQFKYLVGLTGMGKTTLLRNYFKLTDRDIKIRDHNIIIYISFYYANLISDKPQESIQDTVIKYISRTIKKFLELYKSILKDKKKFWLGFYDYIESNKPTLLETEEITPLFSFDDELLQTMSFEYKKKKLLDTCKSSALEYYATLLKYILEITEENYKVIFIYDDIESKDSVFHKPLIELARHVHSCFCATESRDVLIKSIVSLRAYTYRCNIGRQAQARREFIHNDTILKKNTVRLLDIFERRFSVIEEYQADGITTKKLEGYNEAKSQLMYVASQLETIGSNLIFNLANCNLCDSLLIFCNIMTNLEWITCQEQEHNGAFQIDSNNYRITTESLIYAIANLEIDGRIEKSGYVPNIFRNDKEGTDLIGIYIIKYLLNKGITEIYGEKYIEGNDLLVDIRDLFVKRSDSNIRNEYWSYRINYVIEHLYNSGVLLRSLYDIESSDETQIERRYRQNFKLYLSPRGACLYNLLPKNAVLLELYRDDIYTDLPNNDILTQQLLPFNVFAYLVDFLKVCFATEQKNIGSAIPDLDLYQELLGSEFITSTLLEGILKNINVYFKNKDDKYVELIEKSLELCENMKKYSSQLENKFNVVFYISDYLTKLLKE